jgi:hypothetical protein
MLGTMAREKQDAEVNFECLSSQKAAWESAAVRDGRTLSAWIRRTLDLAARSSVEPGEHFPEFPEKS